MRTVLVAAGVLIEAGRVLLTQRKAGAHLEGMWEFPGGKVEAREEPRAALARELREELGIEATIGEELDRYEVRYGDGPLTLLLFYRVDAFRGEPQNLDFEQIVWEKRERLGDYDFLEGDVAFVAKLKITAE